MRPATNYDSLSLYRFCRLTSLQGVSRVCQTQLSGNLDFGLNFQPDGQPLPSFVHPSNDNQP